MAKLIDLGHPIHDGMPAYPGLPPARVSALLTHRESRQRYEDRAEFALTKVEIAGNTGTYLDSPWHRHLNGPDIAGILLEQVADLPGVVAQASVATDGSADLRLDPASARDGAVLVRTDWSRNWETDRYWVDGPHLSQAAIERLLDLRPALVGVDFANVDDPGDPVRPAHTGLLGAGILIVENLCNLDAITQDRFRFHCVPLSVRGAASVPVRPYAQLDLLD